jgi:lipid-binding SYLF domain-containing protein
MVGNLALWLLAAASLLLGQATAERKTGTAGAPAQSAEVVARIEEAGKVFSEIMSAPDKAIPEEILSRAHCIGIIPGMKRAGFIVGGQYGKGVLTCRHYSDQCSANLIKHRPIHWGFRDFNRKEDV